MCGRELICDGRLELRVDTELSRDLSGVSVYPLRTYGPLLTSLTLSPLRPLRASGALSPSELCGVIDRHLLSERCDEWSVSA